MNCRFTVVNENITNRLLVHLYVSNNNFENFYSAYTLLFRRYKFISALKSYSKLL